MSDIVELHPTTDENFQIREIASSILGACKVISFNENIDEIALMAHTLPIRLRREFHHLRLKESCPAIILRSPPFNSEEVPPTPSCIRQQLNQAIDFNDIVHIMFASLLGDVFTFNSIQNGNIVNDVMPMKDDGRSKKGSGFDIDFDLHTDDAFSPYAGEFLALKCFRNPDLIPTKFVALDALDIPANFKCALFKDEFLLKPNVAHHVDPLKIKRKSLLFGSSVSPYIRVNTNFDCSEGASTEAKEAYDWLISKMRQSTIDVVLAPGDAIYIDNFRAAHGRGTYSPRFDGQDRWYRRLYVTAAFRRSRGARKAENGRVIFGDDL